MVLLRARNSSMKIWAAGIVRACLYRWKSELDITHLKIFQYREIQNYDVEFNK